MDPLLPSDPTQIDGYSLTGRLGSGGFGVVFAATTADGRQVAVKLLRPELSDDQRLRTRLGREADALRRVGGDRNVEIFDVVTEGDRAYLVMEFVEGETLAERVADQGPLVGPMLWFAAQGLVEALQAIHAAGIVHRDLKPSNVMYGPDGIKVLDFGISVAAEETGLTQTGAFLGTAAWISPEQILGRDVTEATDVFTLGMVLVFAATGRHPYGEGRADAVMYRITNTEPDLEGIPNPLREAVERCMSLDPAQRPTIDQLASFFGSNGDESLPDAPTSGPVAGGTSIVQPDELAQRLGPRVDDSKDEGSAPVVKRRGRRVFVTLLVLLLLGGGGAIAAIFMFSQQDDEPIEIAAPTTTVTTTATTTTAAPPISLAPTTTVAPATTVAPTTTVLPPTTIRLATTTTMDFDTKTVLTAYYQFRESSSRVKRLQQAIRSVTGDFISADGVYGPVTRREHIRALNKQGLTTSRVPSIPVTTTVPASPRYELYVDANGRQRRWNPCQGAVKIAINPNGHLSETNLVKWSKAISEIAEGLTGLTGINFSFVGQTSELVVGYSGLASSSIDFLIFFGPAGTSELVGPDRDANLFGSYTRLYDMTNYNKVGSTWNEIEYAAIHVQHTLGGPRGDPELYERYLMNYFGRLVGLGSFSDDDSAKGEIMHWGSNGSGTRRNPQWGPGDVIALGLVGASNGCF